MSEFDLLFWKPIESAPRGQIVYVADLDHPEWGCHLMCYNPCTTRWEGRSFGPLGSRTTYYQHPVTGGGPTHWANPTEKPIHANCRCGPDFSELHSMQFRMLEDSDRRFLDE